MADHPPEVTIRSSRLVLWTMLVLLGVEITLVLLDIFVGQNPEASRLPRKMCNLAGESSMANWLASAQTLVVAIVVWLIQLRLKAGGANRWRRLAWGAIALFFLFMALDDGSKMHERLGTMFEIHQKEGGGLGCAGGIHDLLGSYHWLAVVGPVFASMGFFMLFFLWRELQTRQARVILFLALTCFAVAMGLDYIEGVEGGLVPIMRILKADSGPVEHNIMVLEEFIEMFATTLFLANFLQHLTRPEHSVTLVFVDPPSEAETADGDNGDDAGEEGT